jgi:hypothetical protein
VLTLLVSAVFLAALVGAPGYVAYRAIVAPGRPGAAAVALPEALAVSAAAGVLLVGWLSLALVELGWLHLPLLAVLVGLLTAGLAAVARRRGRSLRLGPPRWQTADTVFAGIALLALLLALRPHETILGGTDAGVYANTGASIARTGRLLIADAVTASLAPTARGPRAQTDTPDDAPPGADGAIRHLMLRLPEGRFPFADYLRLAGFYVLDLPSGTLTPQFLHLYPTWLGLFGRALGEAGLLYATPLLGWLGALLAALTGRRLFGAWVGNATLLLLGLNSLQIWFARHSLSEALLQVLLCTAAYGWAAAHDAGEPRARGARGARSLPGPPGPPGAPSPGYLALAGVAFGSLALAHAQFVFAYALLPPLAAWLWLARRWRPAYWAFFGPALLLLAHAALHIGLFALGYVEGLYHHVLLDLWAARVRAGALLVLAASLLFLLNRSRDRWWPLISTACYRLSIELPRLRPRRRPRRWAVAIRPAEAGPPLLAALVGLVLLYAYLVRPGILSAAGLADPARLAGYIGAPVPPGPEANLVRLGWYLSPLGVLLAGIGAVAIVARLDQRRLLLLGLTGIYGLAFNLASFTHESYIYSLRRFVPIVLPFASLAAAYAIVVVVPGLVAAGRPPAWRRRLGQAAAAGALAALVLFCAVTGRTIINHVENEGAREQVAAIAAAFAPADIILFAGPRDEPHKLATPLRFFHGLDALVVSTNNPRGDLIDAWLGQQIRAGRRVRLVLGDNGGKLLLPNFRPEPAGTLTLTLRELERLADQKPYNVQTNVLTYTLYDLHPAAGAPLPGPPYRYQTGPGDELATVIGWYARETDPDGVAYRWTNGDALLRIPWPARRGPLRLRLRLAGGVRPAALGPAQLTLALARGQNDKTAPLIATLQLSEGFATYEVAVPPDLLPDQPTATALLALRGPPWQPSAYGLSSDRRSLGVRVAWVELVGAGA